MVFSPVSLIRDSRNRLLFLGKVCGQNQPSMPRVRRASNKQYFVALVTLSYRNMRETGLEPI